MKSKLQLIRRIEEDLPLYVSEKRLRHIYAVKKLALELCEIFKSFGADISYEDAECAALLHDITKYLDSEELCERYNIPLSENDKKSPETLHAVTAEYFARDKYGEYDLSEGILRAVRYHTVGCADMSLLDNIIFISDYCEETRVHEECQKTRARLLKKLCCISERKDDRLSDALLTLEYIKCEILGKTVKYLSEKGGYIHRDTALTFIKTIEKYADSKGFAELSREYMQYMQQI